MRTGFLCFNRALGTFLNRSHRPALDQNYQKCFSDAPSKAKDPVKPPKTSSGATTKKIDKPPLNGQKSVSAHQIPAQSGDEYGFVYDGPEPTKFGDWAHKGRVTDF